MRVMMIRTPLSFVLCFVVWVGCSSELISEQSSGTGGLEQGAASGGAGTGSGPSTQAGGSWSTGGNSNAADGGSLAGTGGDVGGVGGNASGGSPAGCDPKWLFCDDFESYASGPAPDGPWSIADNYGNWDIGVVDDRSVSGLQSAFFSVETTGRAFMATHDPFPVSGNNFFGRYMIYFSELPGQGVGVHWDVVSALAEDGDDGNYRWGGMWGHMMANYHPGDCYGNAKELIPQAGKWQCIEWQFDGPSRALHVWLDGKHASIENTGGGCVNGPGDATWDAPDEFLQLQIGWAHYQNQLAGNQVWIDDVVIDDERIGCGVEQ
jgi:hypothetical protein